MQLQEILQSLCCTTPKSTASLNVYVGCCCFSWIPSSRPTTTTYWTNATTTTIFTTTTSSSRVTMMPYHHFFLSTLSLFVYEKRGRKLKEILNLVKNNSWLMKMSSLENSCIFLLLYIYIYIYIYSLQHISKSCLTIPLSSWLCFMLVKIYIVCHHQKEGDCLVLMIH